MKTRLLTTLIFAGLFGASAVQAATIVPLNRDAPGVGLNDPTVVSAVGGNPGTTVGQQRQIVYQFAADLWGGLLQSNAQIRVGASFIEKSCTASQAVLGSAGPWYVNRDFTNAPLAATWYHAALANAIAGSNLNSGDPGYVTPDDIEINSSFNAYLGGTNPGPVNPAGSACLTGSGWYYGLDGNTPSNRISFLDVVMHEIAHGLGFSGFVNKTTGALVDFGDGPKSDVYTHFAYDNVSALRFDDPAMTDALRATTMKTPGRLVWDGPTVFAQAPGVLGPLVQLKTSGSLTANYNFGTASFGPAATASNFTGSVVLVNDGSASPNLGCVASPAGAYSGQIAIVDRGSCAFSAKTKNAQDAGAIGVIVANNAAGAAPGLGGSDSTVVIPAIGVSQADGGSIKLALPGVNVTLGTVPGRFAGADANGRTQLYAPTTVAQGSTFSHYDTALTPNAVMEPAINADLDANYRLDLTPGLFTDEAWGSVAGNAIIGGCDTTVGLKNNAGVIAGANVQAWSRVCKSNRATSRMYVRCMYEPVLRLKNAGFITSAQANQVNTCAAQTGGP